MPDIYQVTCRCGRKSGKYTTDLRPLAVLLKGAGWRRWGRYWRCPFCPVRFKRKGKS